VAELLACHYSLAGATPPAPASWSFAERVDAAAAAGFAAMGITGREYLRLRTDGASDARLQRMLTGAGIRVDEVEIITGWLDPDAGSVAAREAIDAAVDAFEPHHVIAGDPRLAPRLTDVHAAAAGFVTLCERVAASRTRVAIEFIPGTRIPDVDTASAIVEAAGQANGGILLDTYHHFSPGGTVAELLAVPATRFAGVQLGDHLLNDTASHFDGWRYHGLPPGEGELGLHDAVAALIDHGVQVPWGVEVLSPALNALGPREAAQVLARSARSVMGAETAH